jgi:membrane protease YdiL (CAAX protease family)
VPIGLLAAAAVATDLRPVLLAALIAGFVVAWRTSSPYTAAWAGSIPVAVSLAWGLVPLPATATDGSTCTQVPAPFATFRVVDAALALVALGVVAPLVHASGREIGLRRPSDLVLAIALGGALVVGPVALALGPPLAEPWFGPLPVQTGDLRAIVPAALFALSNGVMEEVAYRGALQAWLSRSTGIGIAVAAQAVVFGLAHGASQDFIVSPLPVVALMTVGAAIAGFVTVRTGSLALPIALHVAFDIPLYYGNACVAS